MDKAELEHLIKVTRRKIPEWFPEKHQRKRVLSAYDALTQDILSYIRGKWFLNLKPVAHKHFKEMWNLNYYIIRQGDMSVFNIKCHNTASMAISSEVLRPIGQKYGFIKA